MTTWISPDAWTGADPTPSQLEAVTAWQRRTRDFELMKQRGLRVRPPRHPFYRPDSREQRLRPATHTRYYPLQLKPPR